MNELINSFLEEANELISDLEDSLLTLEQSPNDKDAVHQVFRVMHTLKGSGGMFGFMAVSDFTHHLENIYYQIRNGKLDVSKEILTLTLKSVDLIKELLKTSGESSSEIKKQTKELVEEIKAISSSKKTETAISTNESTINEDIVGLNTFYIHFIPNPEILQNGTNPLYLIDELNALGNSYVIADTKGIPESSEINLENCYVSWEILLSTQVDIGEIMDVFIFVEDDSNIEIQHIHHSDLLQQEKFIQAVKDYEKQNRSLNILQLQELAKALVAIESSGEEVTIENQQSTSVEIIEKENPPEENIKAKTIKAPTNGAPPLSSIRVSSKKIESLMNLVSEMVTTQARLNLISDELKNQQLSDAVDSLQKITRQLRDNALEISLIPIDSMITRFKRLIRDLSNDMNKEISFSVEGAETELDKTIIENLSDPLMHIFRNAIDHGIEDQETRKSIGKPAIGKIILKAFYSGTNVFIQIIDDGGGIDPEVIRKQAIAKGIIRKDENLSNESIIDLITYPGFSTAKTISDISGRGVGMDVVKKNIQKIQGELLIESTLGVGTTFTLKLPLTLSIIDGLIVEVEDTPYIIPITMINKIRPIQHKLIENAFNNRIVIDNNQIPFINLRDKFNISSAPPLKEQLIVVNFEDKQMGIVVDRIYNQSQVVVKSIGKQFHYHDIISGASILGNGQVALVLDTNKIINSIDYKSEKVKVKSL